MPRKYDYSAPETPELYDDWGLFVPFLEHGKPRPVAGKTEASLQDLWGDKSFLVGVRHQYELSTPAGVSPYDNALLDEIHSWLDENAAGRWNWLEHVINNGRSVGTDVYLEDEDAQKVFEGRWGHLFKRDEHAFEHNASLKAGAPTP